VAEKRITKLKHLTLIFFEKRKKLSMDEAITSVSESFEHEAHRDKKRFIYNYENRLIK
jgi:hypothetical protein